MKQLLLKPGNLMMMDDGIKMETIFGDGSSKERWRIHGEINGSWEKAANG